MKTIALVFGRLADYYRSNRLIFSLFIVASLVCNIAFIYCFGNAMTYMYFRNSPVDLFQRYIIEFDEGRTLTDEELEALASIGDMQDIALCKYLNNDHLTYLYASLWETGTWYPSEGRNTFTADELEGEPVVIVPTTAQKNRTGSINLLGSTYTVIGVHALNSEFRIPYQTFINKEIKPDMVQLVCSELPSEKEDRQIQAQLHALFPDDYISSPLWFQNIGSRAFPLEIGIMAILYAVCLLSFMFLMKYMVEKSYMENIIYAIVGASRFTVVRILFLESLFVSVITGLGSILLHMALYNVLFEKLNFVPYITYKPVDYLIILLSTMLVTVLINLPFIISHYRYSLITMKNKYMK